MFTLNSLDHVDISLALVQELLKLLHSDVARVADDKTGHILQEECVEKLSLLACQLSEARSRVEHAAGEADVSTEVHPACTKGSVVQAVLYALQV